MSTNSNPRLHYLDAARGIAALMVLAGHYINWRYESLLSMKLLSLVFNANDAVSFFFVLSGFVLSYPAFVLDKTIDIKKFYVNRVFRLMPGFLVAFLLNYFYSIRTQIVEPGIGMALMNNEGDFWRELFLLRGYNVHYLPSWTLTVELAMSFMIPFFILVLRQDKRWLPWLVLAIFLGQHLFSMFTIHFLLGMCIAIYFNYIRSDEFSNTKWYRYRKLILLSCVVLFSLRKIHAISPLGIFLLQVMDYTKLEFFFFSGIASAVFIIAMLRSRAAQNILQNKVLLFYGKISYGIYLAHWVVVRFIFEYWDRLLQETGFTEKQQFIVLFAALFVSSTLMATAIYYFVELPFMRWGKRITQRFKPGLKV